MRNYRINGSYTIEAAIYIPIILGLLFLSLRTGIAFWKKSSEREGNKLLQEMDIVQEFYRYQILDEIGESIGNDNS